MPKKNEGYQDKLERMLRAAMLVVRSTDHFVTPDLADAEEWYKYDLYIQKNNLAVKLTKL